MQRTTLLEGCFECNQIKRPSKSSREMSQRGLSSLLDHLLAKERYCILSQRQGFAHLGTGYQKGGPPDQFGYRNPGSSPGTRAIHCKKHRTERQGLIGLRYIGSSTKCPLQTILVKRVSSGLTYPWALRLFLSSAHLQVTRFPARSPQLWREMRT